MDRILRSNKQIALDAEQDRVVALRRYQILDTPAEQSFDNLVKLAAQFFNVPISTLVFVDTENAFLKAIVGTEGQRKTPRGNTLCTLTIQSDEVLVFEDLDKVDPCSFVDPVMIAEMGFKFYAGAPIITHDGFRIGTICVIGSESRQFTSHEADLLKSLARIAMDEIELRLKGIAEADSKINSLTKQVEELITAHADLEVVHDELAVNYNSLKTAVQKLLIAEPRLNDLL